MHTGQYCTHEATNANNNGNNTQRLLICEAYVSFNGLMTISSNFNSAEFALKGATKSEVHTLYCHYPTTSVVNDHSSFIQFLQQAENAVAFCYIKHSLRIY